MIDGVLRKSVSEKQDLFACHFCEHSLTGIKQYTTISSAKYLPIF